MKALIQRVDEASVCVEGKVISSIKRGMLVLLGVEKDDSEQDIDYTIKKIINLRMFQDSEGKLNLSVRDVGGDMLVVSQFTLAASLKKGNRPSFDNSAEPVRAKSAYLDLINKIRKEGIRVSEGEFGAYMKVGLVNDGPVTFILDSRNK